MGQCLLSHGPILAVRVQEINQHQVLLNSPVAAAACLFDLISFPFFYFHLLTVSSPFTSLCSIVPGAPGSLQQSSQFAFIRLPKDGIGLGFDPFVAAVAHLLIPTFHPVGYHLPAQSHLLFQKKQHFIFFVTPPLLLRVVLNLSKVLHVQNQPLVEGDAVGLSLVRTVVDPVLPDGLYDLSGLQIGRICEVGVVGEGKVEVWSCHPHYTL